MVALQVKIISLDIGLSSVNDILLAGGLMDRIMFDHFCMFLMSQRKINLDSGRGALWELIWKGSLYEGLQQLFKTLSGNTMIRSNCCFGTACTEHCCQSEMCLSGTSLLKEHNDQRFNSNATHNKRS